MNNIVPYRVLWRGYLLTDRLWRASVNKGYQYSIL